MRVQGLAGVVVPAQGKGHPRRAVAGDDRVGIVRQIGIGAVDGGMQRVVLQGDQRQPRMAPGNRGGSVEGLGGAGVAVAVQTLIMEEEEAIAVDEMQAGRRIEQLGDARGIAVVIAGHGQDADAGFQQLTGQPGQIGRRRRRLAVIDQVAQQHDQPRLDTLLPQPRQRFLHQHRGQRRLASRTGARVARQRRVMQISQNQNVENRATHAGQCRPFCPA